MSRRILLALFAAICLVLVLPEPAQARTSAKAFVKDRHGHLVKLLQQPKSATNDAAVQKIVDGMLDYGTIARRSLGDHWDKLTDAQRQEFQSVLSELVRRAYQRDLRRTLGYSVKIEGTEAVADGTLVKTVATNRRKPREEPIDIDYVLRVEGGSWVVVDIITDGSSLVGNYRSQFGGIIRDKGFGDLMARMRKKLAEG
jgi:phospholipid transport system substrate-binding protein